MRRVVFIIVAVLVVVIALGAGAIYWFLSGDGIRRALEQQAGAWLGQPVAIGGARAQLFPRPAIHLTDVRAGAPVRITLGAVDVSTDLQALFGRRIEDAQVTISRSRVQMPLSFGVPGPGESSAPTDNPPTDSSSGVRLVSVRTIALRDVQLVSRGREVLVSADSSLAGNELQLERFTATSGATSLSASGVVQLAPRLDARLRVTANQLDVDEMLALASAFVPPAGRGAPGRGEAPQPARIAARVSSERAT